MKIWGGRLCHVLDHITWYNLPMMIIHSYSWPKCAYWTWMFFFQLLKLPPHSDLIVMEQPHPWPLCWVRCAACPNGLSCQLTAHNGQVLDHSMLHKYIYTSSMFQFVTQFLNGLPSLASLLLSRKLNFQIFKKFKHNKMPCAINFLRDCNFLATYSCRIIPLYICIEFRN